MRIFLLTALFLTACAEPKYAARPAPANPPLTPTEQAAPCAVTLPKSGRCVRLTWTKVPTAEEPGSLLAVTEGASTATGLPVMTDLAGELRAHLWMPSMNHGSTPITIRTLATGVYLLDEVYFIMPGDWTIHLQVWQNGALFEEGLFALEI